ncbi:MAG: cbb3-type cytochrome oxidase assembly protein CcoS [Laribacter sp.]|nr:cbb3-type cytochrome oxidase assembly protein CcoS [Laribacter sp.]MBP9607941.1 cbb3-type cytochrome oxidase assembly protein CcoS [Laribacter sp.]
MESLYLLIPMSIVLAFGFGALFWWATRSGQFDDLEGPGHRILMDDDSTHAEEQPDAGTPPDTPRRS